MLLQIENKLGIDTMNLISKWNPTFKIKDFQNELQIALLNLQFEISFRIMHVYEIATAENTMEKCIIDFAYKQYREFISAGTFKNKSLKELINSYNQLLKVYEFRGNK